MKLDYRKDELEALGVAAAQIDATYWELRERERQQREWKWNVRDTFFSLSGCGTGQRYKTIHRRALTEGDMTNLPSFDVLTCEMVAFFPELDCGDACQRLFELVCEPYDRLPPAADSYREAIDRVLDDICSGSVAAFDCATPY
jgi:hypothetical protein